MAESLSCLVTGATGYIGGRLVPSLLAAGHRVRCMARDPGKLAGHAYWWTVWPFHGLVSGAMTRNIATAAERSPRDGTLT